MPGDTTEIPTGMMVVTKSESSYHACCQKRKESLELVFEGSWRELQAAAFFVAGHCLFIRTFNLRGAGPHRYFLFAQLSSLRFRFCTPFVKHELGIKVGNPRLPSVKTKKARANKRRASCSYWPQNSSPFPLWLVFGKLGAEVPTSRLAAQIFEGGA